MSTPDSPVFVNLQSTNVGVYDERGRKIYISPYHRKGINPVVDAACGAVYEVSGDHYLAALAPRGPLALKPDAAVAEVAAPIVPPIEEVVVPPIEEVVVPPIEEPVAEEPVAEEPVAEEPVAEEPVSLRARARRK